MNYGQMKNIVVLKDFQSNIVDEAIVILKNNVDIKKKEIADGKSEDDTKNNSQNYNFIVQEAEKVIRDYVNNTERTRENKKSINKILIKYRKLQIYSFLLGISMLITIIASIIK